MNYMRDPVRRKATKPAWRLLPLAALVSGACVGQPEVDWDLIDEYCTECHNLDDFAGSTAFDLMPRDSLIEDADTWEMAIRKVSTGMMPQPASRDHHGQHWTDSPTTWAPHWMPNMPAPRIPAVKAWPV